MQSLGIIVRYMYFTWIVLDKDTLWQDASTATTICGWDVDGCFIYILLPWKELVLFSNMLVDIRGWVLKVILAKLGAGEREREDKG